MAPELVADDGLKLRPTTTADRAALIAIRSTPEVSDRWPGDPGARFDEELADADTTQFTIESSGGAVVGMIQYWEETEPDYRHGGIDIYVEPALHRRGIGSGALRLMIRHLIDDLGHHRVTIDPAADNEAAIACYEKVGFRPVGRLRSYERGPDGTWHDGLLMDLLADEVS